MGKGRKTTAGPSTSCGAQSRTIARRTPLRMTSDEWGGVCAASPRSLFLKGVVAISGTTEVMPFQNGEEQPQIPRLRSG